MKLKKRGYGWILIGVVVLLAAGLWPSDYRRIYRVGTDSYETHYPLYKDRSRSVRINAAENVTGLGVLVVNLRRVEKLSDVKVVVKDKEAVIASGIIEGREVEDDKFAWVDFGRVVLKKGEMAEVKLSAPAADSGSAIGWRYDDKTGLGAVAVIERVPMWKQVRFWTEVYPNIAGRFFNTLGWGLAAAAWLFWLGKDWRWGRVNNWMVGIGILIGLVIWTRLPLMGQIESAFGGDIFNYLLKSREWLAGGDPFAADFRKAPLMSLLLLPGFLPGFDQVIWGRVISGAAAAVTVLLIVMVSRGLKLPTGLALGAGLLLAVNREFWWESAHGLANSLFAMLVLMSVYIFVRYKDRLGSYKLGVVGSLAFLTRYEGGVVPAVLMPMMWWYKRRWGEMARSVLSMGLLLAIPFIMWPFSGEVGVRTLADIRDDSGLYVVTSGEDWQNNVMAFKLFMGRLWLLQPLVGRQWQWLGWGIGLGVLISWRQARKGRLNAWTSPLILLVMAAGLLWVVGRGSGEMYKILGLAVTGLMGIGISGLLVRKWKEMGPVMVMALGLWLAVTMILPKTRYYMWLIPLMTLAIVYGLWMLSRGKRSRVSRAAVLGLMGMWVMLVYIDSREALPGRLSDYNEKSARQTVMLGAARQLKRETGKVAVIADQDLQLRVYLGPDRILVTDTEDKKATEKIEWLRNKQAEYVVETSAIPYWQEVVDAYPDKFELINTFETRYSLIESSLYVVNK